MELPNTKIRSVLPSAQQIGNPANIVDAWNGAAVDAKRNRLIVWGGGHNDYYGNEVYALELSTMSIKRIVDPSPQRLAVQLQLRAARRHTGVTPHLRTA